MTATTQETVIPESKYKPLDKVECKKPGYESCTVKDAKYNQAHKTWYYEVFNLQFKPLWVKEKELYPSAETIRNKICWNGKELLETNLPEPEQIVPSLITEGMNIIASRPKMGKSWLTLQLAKSVAFGEPFLGREVKQGKVLYLALEDGPASIKSRMEIQKWLINGAENVVFYYQWDFLDKGNGLRKLRDEILQNNYKLVVIDTISRALSGVTDQNKNEKMTIALSPLQQLAKGFAIVVNDHHSKTLGSDPIDSVMGSTAKTGVADTIIGLYRESRAEKQAVIKTAGRLIRDVEWAIEFDNGLWKMLGNADAVAANRKEKEILEALDILDDNATQTEIINYTGYSKGEISKVLTNLRKRGMVTWEGKQKPYKRVTDTFDLLDNIKK